MSVTLTTPVELVGIPTVCKGKWYTCTATANGVEYFIEYHKTEKALVRNLWRGMIDMLEVYTLKGKFRKKKITYCRYVDGWEGLYYPAGTMKEILTELYLQYGTAENGIVY